MPPASRAGRRWAGAGLGVTALLLALVTRPRSSLGSVFGLLWPWLTLALWVLLLLAGLALVGFVWRRWVAVRAAAGAAPSDAFDGDPLPGDLGYLTIDGRVSAGDGGMRFFPQWLGIPDDAGGFWFSPDRSPQGADMYGMICTSPIDLGDGWWSCGM